MSTNNRIKLNQLLSQIPPGIVLQSHWLKAQGYSLDLQKRYRSSGWFKSVGAGAMIRTNDTPSYEGAVYALQQQSGMTVHPAAKTAFEIIGLAHYVPMSTDRVLLFGSADERLPGWFRKYDWGRSVVYRPTSFLPPELGLVDVAQRNFSIKVSGPVRAMMECLYLVPEKQDLVECYHLMEGLNNVRPSAVQELLESSSSIKVKRLFLYLADKVGHDWFSRLDLSKIDLGSGKRSITKKGFYNSKYAITVPRELEHTHAGEI